MNKKELIENLYRIASIKFGTFPLKSGQVSPIYVDLRRTLSFPSIMKALSKLMLRAVENVPFDLVCGVPYGAIPLATAMSLESNKPLIMQRKSIKEHGTKKEIEGVFTPNQTCLVIEDIVTSGGSTLETVRTLERHNICVSGVVCAIDREQGAAENLRHSGVSLHASLSISSILETLVSKALLSQEDAERTLHFLHDNPVVLSP